MQEIILNFPINAVVEKCSLNLTDICPPSKHKFICQILSDRSVALYIKVNFFAYEEYMACTIRFINNVAFLSTKVFVCFFAALCVLILYWWLQC